MVVTACHLSGYLSCLIQLLDFISIDFILWEFNGLLFARVRIRDRHTILHATLSELLVSQETVLGSDSIGPYLAILHTLLIELESSGQLGLPSLLDCLVSHLVKLGWLAKDGLLVIQVLTFMGI